LEGACITGVGIVKSIVQVFIKIWIYTNLQAKFHFKSLLKIGIFYVLGHPTWTKSFAYFKIKPRYMFKKTTYTRIVAYTALIISAITILNSCQREISGEGFPVIVTGTGWTTQTVTPATHPVTLLLKSLQKPEVVTIINQATGGICNSGNCTGFIPDNAFVKLDNSPVTGSVTLTTTTATNYTDMVFNGFGTLTDNELLITGGMMRIRATQGSDVLKLKTGKTITVVFPQTSNPAFKGYAGKETGEVANPVKWDLNNNWTVLPDSGITNQVVQIRIDSLGWVNCDRVMNLPGAPTQIYVTLPSQFGNSNANVYMVFTSIKSIIGLFGDAANQRFWPGSSYRVPTGENVKLVAIGKTNNKIYYGITQVNIGTNITVPINTMTEVTETELKDQLNAL
jgi:hypothetical protein